MSRLDQLVARYREDHRNPINHVLHVGVGWPIMAAAVVLVPFRPLWSLGLFVTSYTIMWAGHFAVRAQPAHDLPGSPSTPFVMAWAVIRGLGVALVRLVTAGRAR